MLSGKWVYVFGGLKVDGPGNTQGAPWTDRAEISPTGELGPFLPQHSDMRQQRAFYGLGFGFNGGGTLTNLFVLGGMAFEGGGSVQFNEFSLWR